MLLLLGVFTALTVRAERLPVGTVIATGTCGDNLTWTLTANGERPFDSVHKTQCDGITMTISGTGAMADNSFSSIFGQTLANNSGLTIDELLKRISNVIIEEDVTSIGNNAFSGFKNMRRITLPSTLTSIGSQAFYQCDALKSVDIPDNVTYIGYGVFQECDSLRSVSLSAGIKTIPARAFKNCVRLMTLRLKRYVPGDDKPITVFDNGYTSSTYTFNSIFAFYNCTALATLIVPKAGMETYQSSPCWQIYPFLRVKNNKWTEANSNSNTCYDLIYFRYIIRPDCDILFEAGTTNRWTTWVDKVNHAAPRGAEVYTIYNVGNGEVTLNRITARVTLPETMRDGAGDNGVRALVPAFVPVLIKRPAGTLTEDLTMPFVMGGDPVFENGWYTSDSSPSIWVKDLPGYFDNIAEGHGYVSTVFPDVMANAPYGYSFGISYDINPYGFSASGSGRWLDDPNYDTGIKDAVEGRTLDNSIFYGNADKNGLSECFHALKYMGRTAYAFEDDAFRPMSDAEKEGKLASHQCALLVSPRTTFPDQLTLSINERTEVTLAADANNTSAIEAAARQKNTRVTLSGHTFYLDGDWNTLCLPFSINLLTEYKDRDHIFQFFGNNGYGIGSSDDAIVMELDTEGEYNGKKTGLDDGGTLNLYFKRADAIEAGKPYLVKWRFRNEYSISDPVFYDAKFVYVPPTPDLIINSVSDWNTFAQNVNNGMESYEGKLVRLDADLDGVTTMVGTSSNKFEGTFDGNGHTLDINLYGISDCMAPFSYIEGATIKNLRTTGSVMPTSVYTSDLHPVTFPGGKFVGTYSPISYSSTDPNILFLGAANKLCYPESGATINAFRAYFELSDGAGVREFKLNFGDNEITAVANSKLYTLNSTLSEWYTIDGRKLQGKPTKKGIYVNRGRKVAIK